MASDVVADVLLGLAVLAVASASVGVLVMRDAYQKLHFVTPAALVAPVAGRRWRCSSRWGCTRTPARRSWPCCSW